MEAGAVGGPVEEPLARTASEGVYDVVRRSIVEGTVKPGERVVEERIAEDLGVSRTPVREALVRLERENLIARSNRGMVVRSFTPRDVYDIYDLRAQVESYAARLASERMSDYELHELERIQREMVTELHSGSADDLGWPKRLAQINQSFHLAVVRAAQSDPLERIMTQVVQTPVIYKAYLWYDSDDQRRSTADHETMLQHLAARDGSAAESCWRAHIEFGRDVLVENLTKRLD